MRRQFVLEAIDPVTGCPGLAARFAVDEQDIFDLCAIVGSTPAEIDAGVVCDLASDVAARVESRFAVIFESGSLAVRLRPWGEHDDLPYEDHTNRELALMLREDSLSASTSYLVRRSDRVARTQCGASELCSMH